MVIGILIALQINNKNEWHKTRAKEVVYLSNINADLVLNMTSLEEFIDAREAIIQSVDVLLEYFEREKALNLDSFNLNNLNVLVWYPFIQNANTYQELMNSGNFAIISNKEIKNELQDMQSEYEMIAFIENEMQQDYESYLYDPYMTIADLNTALKNFDHQLANGSELTAVEIDLTVTETLLKHQAYKNGLVLSAYNSDLLVTSYKDMMGRTQKLIERIDHEITQ